MKIFTIICAATAALCGAILFATGDVLTASALCSLAGGLMASKF